MYGTITKPSHFEDEYVSLNPIQDIENDNVENKNVYYNIAGCIVVFITVYGIVFYMLK
jgi:hypothetical protein